MLLRVLQVEIDRVFQLLARKPRFQRRRLIQRVADRVGIGIEIDADVQTGVLRTDIVLLKGVVLRRGKSGPEDDEVIALGLDLIKIDLMPLPAGNIDAVGIDAPSLALHPAGVAVAIGRLAGRREQYGEKICNGQQQTQSASEFFSSIPHSLPSAFRMLCTACTYIHYNYTKNTRACQRQNPCSSFPALRLCSAAADRISQAKNISTSYTCVPVNVHDDIFRCLIT